VTESSAKAIVRPSLWAPPTTWTRTSGLRATKAAARVGSMPRPGARRAAIAARASTEAPPISFSATTAIPTGSQASA